MHLGIRYLGTSTTSSIINHIYYLGTYRYLDTKQDTVLSPFIFAYGYMALRWETGGNKTLYSLSYM